MKSRACRMNTSSRCPRMRTRALSPSITRVSGSRTSYALGGETYLLVLQNDPGPRKMEAVINDDTRVMIIQPNLVYWDHRSGSYRK